MRGPGCARRDDCGGGGGAGWRGAVPGDDPEPARDGATAGEAAGTGDAPEGVLRGGADGVRAVLAAHRPRSALRRDRADAGAREAGRPGEDGPAGRREAGGAVSRRALTPVWVPDQAQGAARPGAGARGGEERPVAGAPPAAEVSV